MQLNFLITKIPTGVAQLQCINCLINFIEMHKIFKYHRLTTDQVVIED